MIPTETQIEAFEASVAALATRMPELPLTEILLYRLILHLSRSMKASLEQRSQAFGLAEAEWWALTALYAQPDGTAHPSDLCAGALLSPTNVSRICDELVNREAITRVPSSIDRRRVILQITDAGDQLVRRILPTMVELLRYMFEEWPESEQDYLISQLKRLDANLALNAVHDAPPET